MVGIIRVVSRRSHQSIREYNKVDTKLPKAVKPVASSGGVSVESFAGGGHGRVHPCLQVQYHSVIIHFPIKNVERQ